MTPATDWKETVPEGEAARFGKYAELLRELQRGRAKGGAASRALHAKGIAGVEAVLEVLPDLPEYARVGLFASPASYRAYVRFSNGMGARQADGKPDVRGIAIKLLGVDGKKIIPGMEDAKTQDFLLIDGPVTPFRDADEFVGLVHAASQPLLLVPRMIKKFGVVRSVQLLRKFVAGVSRPITSVATMRYFSALPIKFGPYAVHYALMPHAPAEPGAKKGSAPNYLSDELAGRLRQGPVVFDFCVQFYRDDTSTPIEDGSVEWLEKDAPFLTIARLSLTQGDVSSPDARRVAELIETLSFDPWHALEELRPLGNMMRARNAAYRLSTQERRAAPEP